MCTPYGRHMYYFPASPFMMVRPIGYKRCHREQNDYRKKHQPLGVTWAQS